MDTFEKINTLEKAKQFFKPYTSYEDMPTRQMHLGQVPIPNHRKDTDETEEVWKYVIEECMPPIRLVTWKDIKPLMDNKEIMSWGGLDHNSYQYLKFLHEGWTEKCRPRHGMKGGSMDFMTVEGEYKTITTPLEITEEERKRFARMYGYQEGNQDYIDLLNGIMDESLQLEHENTIQSIYYHAAKAHWLINDIQNNGLWQPIQGLTHHTGNPGGKNSLSIHPGSMRSRSFQSMDYPDNTCLVTDYANCFPNHPSLSYKDITTYWLSLCSKDCKNVSAIYTDQKKIEFSVPLQQGGGTDFRKYVYDFNKKVSLLCKKKPLNIYIGYDSSHDNIIHEVCEKSIYDSIERSKSKGVGEDYFNDYKIEVKLLDISKLKDYNRDYANQSTEFTYSRFLIPYLENYEGFSIFIDNDYIWKRTPLPFFYFLDPDNAVACVQYDFEHHDEVKMGGEKNVSYPKKLWSSMMIFNNGHEDCKKLTPEVVNTATGKYLHQFEWTDKISKIPHGKIATEGFETECLDSHHAVHYTRGGPWIKGMDCSNINMLEQYYKVKSTLPNKD